MSELKLTSDELRYFELLTDYCLLTGISDPDPIMAGGEFNVEGTDFRMPYIPQSQSGMLCVWCDFGAIPEGTEAKCYMELLHANTANHDGSAPMMALCPDSALVVCSARLPLARLTAQTLHKILRALAANASAWRQRVWQEAPALLDADA